MTAIITGDIINSGNYLPSQWLTPLKNFLAGIGSTPGDWEVYRGDEFQIRVDQSEALMLAIRIKALIKTIKGLDVRMAIGLGDETYRADSVSESNGSAYQRSGRIFELLKQRKINLMISTGNKDKDLTLNLLMQLALNFMDEWSKVSAEIVTLALENPKTSQKEIASQLSIQQSAVSQRQKRARLDLTLALLDYYTKTIETAAI